ncbi:MAG: hypothetical protein LBI10_13005 [Deltaproteobacteria bacterium]|nr:hypothetical protein [Deltaproteobacteria bacterium]
MFKPYLFEPEKNPADQDARARPFAGQSFDPPKPKTVSENFQEFKAAPRSGLNIESLSEPQASIGYLFEPFAPLDPKASSLGQEAFAATKVASSSTFEFQDLDLKDENIVNTLDKAEKKARATVLAAEAKEKELVALAKDKALALETELKNAAEAKAAALTQAAEEAATKIRLAAQASVDEAALTQVAMEELKQEIAKAKEEVSEAKALAQKKQDELTSSQAALKEREEALVKAEAALPREKEKALAAAKTEGLALGLAEGQAKGYEEGLAKGLSQGRTEALNKLKGLFTAVTKVDNIWRDLWTANGAFMVELAVDAAEAILAREIKGGQNLAAGAFKAAISYLTQSKEAVFRVNPHDLAELEAARADPDLGLDSLVNVVFTPDPALSPGDLVMEADVGRLDATVKTRRDQVMGALRAALAEGVLAPVPDPLAQNSGSEAAEPKSSPLPPEDQKGLGPAAALAPSSAAP